MTANPIEGESGIRSLMTESPPRNEPQRTDNELVLAVAVARDALRRAGHGSYNEPFAQGDYDRAVQELINFRILEAISKKGNGLDEAERQEIVRQTKAQIAFSSRSPTPPMGIVTVLPGNGPLPPVSIRAVHENFAQGTPPEQKIDKPSLRERIRWEREVRENKKREEKIRKSVEWYYRYYLGYPVDLEVLLKSLDDVDPINVNGKIFSRGFTENDRQAAELISGLLLSPLNPYRRNPYDKSRASKPRINGYTVEELAEAEAIIKAESVSKDEREMVLAFHPEWKESSNQDDLVKGFIQEGKLMVLRGEIKVDQLPQQLENIMGKARSNVQNVQRINEARKILGVVEQLPTLSAEQVESLRKTLEHLHELHEVARGKIAKGDRLEFKARLVRQKEKLIAAQLALKEKAQSESAAEKRAQLGTEKRNNEDNLVLIASDFLSDSTRMLSEITKPNDQQSGPTKYVAPRSSIEKHLENAKGDQKLFFRMLKADGYPVTPEQINQLIDGLAILEGREKLISESILLLNKLRTMMRGEGKSSRQSTVDNEIRLEQKTYDDRLAQAKGESLNLADYYSRVQRLLSGYSDTDLKRILGETNRRLLFQLATKFVTEQEIATAREKLKKQKEKEKSNDRKK